MACKLRLQVPSALRAPAAPHLYYKGFPKTQAPRWFFSSSLLPPLIRHPLRSLIEKMVDCETTTAHVGHVARTLMEDARRGLNREKTREKTVRKRARLELISTILPGSVKLSGERLDRPAV